MVRPQQPPPTCDISMERPEADSVVAKVTAPTAVRALATGRREVGGIAGQHGAVGLSSRRDLYSLRVEVMDAELQNAGASDGGGVHREGGRFQATQPVDGRSGR